MRKEKNKIDINKHEIDIDTLKKQNVYDLLSIKELYKRIEELGEKITQIKYIDNTIVNKLKKEYLNLEKLILDENIQIKLTNDIKTIISQIETINSQLDNKANKDDIDVGVTPLVDERIFTGNEVTNANVKEHSISLGNGSGKQVQSAILAIGVDVLKNNVEGTTNSDAGKYNTAVGHHSMTRNTTGDHNSAFGWGCMGMNTTGKFNTAVGEDALLSNTTGECNTCVGNRAYQLGQGSRNTVIGNNAMYTSESGATPPTGNANTVVGYLAGNDRGNGQNNVAVGADARIADSCSYSISIGSNARVTKSKQCVIGTKNNIIENILHGDVIIYSSGKYRKLVFNSDYSISWTEVTI